MTRQKSCSPTGSSLSNRYHLHVPDGRRERAPFDTNSCLERSEMSSSVDLRSYRTWVQGLPPAQRNPAKSAIDKFCQLQSKRSVSESDLSLLVSAVRNRFAPVWEVGTDLLFRLARKHAAARDAIRSLMCSTKVTDRFHVIAMLGHLSESVAFPKRFSMELIRTALRDKGNRVREKGAQAAERLCLTELVPDLEACLKTECNESPKWAMQHHLLLLRDGYYLEYINGSPELTIRTKDGFTSVSISKDDIRGGKLPSIVAEMQADES